MTKTYILTVFVYNGTVMIQHQSYAFSTEALAVKTKEALQKINKEKADKRLRIAYSIQEAPLYKVITDIPIFKDYQPAETTDAPAQPDNAPTQDPIDTAETSITDEEALSHVSHLETPGQEQETEQPVNNGVSTAASSTSEVTDQPAKPQEQKPKSVHKITFKTAGKSSSAKSVKPKKK